MRFTYVESMTDPSYYAPLAIAAEEAGYDSFAVPDNLGYAGKSAADYPYTEDGDNAFLEDKPFLEPFTVIPALGAVTERLRFTTLVLKLPVRAPYLVAKQAASIAVLTGNRLGLGIGLSPWPEDFALTQTEMRTRGARMEEAIEIIRGVTTGEFFEYEGRHYSIPRVKMCPVPTAPIPLLYGGHSEAALRRTVRLCDGWMHAGGPPEELTHLLNRIAELRKEYNREHDPFEIHAISADAYSVDGIRSLEDAGVTDAIVGFRDVYSVVGRDSEPLEQKIDALRQYADTVISKVC